MRLSNAWLRRRSNDWTSLSNASRSGTTISAAFDGAYIGDQVRDRHIDFVPHAAHNRDSASGDRARHTFVVERPKILCRPTAPGHDHDVQVVDPLNQLERRHDALGCVVALHPAIGD
jgi:hypothetical protein